MSRKNLYLMLSAVLATCAVLAIISVKNAPRPNRRDILIGILTGTIAGLGGTATGFLANRIAEQRKQQHKQELDALMALETDRLELDAAMAQETDRIRIGKDFKVRFVKDISLLASTTAPSHEAVNELRRQIHGLAEKFEKQRNEIVEVHKIDPVLEATLTLSVENLTKRIETLEGKQLGEWQVVSIIGQVIGAGVVLLTAAGGAMFYVARHLK